MTKQSPLINQKIYLAGHSGMVGRALHHKLQALGCKSIITASHSDLDLRNQSATQNFIAQHKPDLTIIAAAKVGGIGANSAAPADFLYDNLMIASNIIHAAHSADCDRLLFLGSSCIYPKEAPQPLQESALLTAQLEPTNEAYALAKIAGIKLCQSYHAQYKRQYFSAMPCNLYGPHDHFDPQTSHVIPALIHKMHQAKLQNAKSLSPKSLTLWGTGTPQREFLHVDDLAEGLITLLHHPNPPHITNIGSGQEISIHDLAALIARTVNYQGEIHFDPSKPDGTMRKILDSRFINALGWRARITLEQGLTETYKWYLAHAG